MSDACHPPGPAKAFAGDLSRLHGHALRNARLRARSLERARTAPPLAQAVVEVRAAILGLTRLEAARQSGISRAAFRDMELGLHTPTRHTLQQFLDFCEARGVPAEPLEAIRRLYAGEADTLEHLVARLELRAGSSRELARRVGISPATLWEYRRGNFPLPHDMLVRLCEAVGQDPTAAEDLWHRTERARLQGRGYPAPLAELCVLCARAGKPLSQVLSTAALRRLRYFELPRWSRVADAARTLCRSDREFLDLQTLWHRAEGSTKNRDPDNNFGTLLKRLREQHGLDRRALADLFNLKGQKPARIIKYIEEDGFYSRQAYPAALVALLAGRGEEAERLLRLWEKRRQVFHRRHRPEVRVDLRLAREKYGFSLHETAAFLGYTPREYQRVEAGLEPLRDTARERILRFVEQTGQERVEQLLQERRLRLVEDSRWRAPRSVGELITLLARREGGLAPLARLLRRTPGLEDLSSARLRAVARGADTPPWCILSLIGRAAGVEDLSVAHHDWTDRYLARLHARGLPPLAVHLRLLIAEHAPSLRAFSPRLGVNYSVLTREFQRLDASEPIAWFHVERILRAVGLPPMSQRAREIQAIWSQLAHPPAAS